MRTPQFVVSMSVVGLLLVWPLAASLAESSFICPVPQPGGGSSTAYGVSSDGKTVVGWTGTQERGYQAFCWTEVGGMLRLGLLSGDFTSIAYGVSSDGKVVVGESYTYTEKKNAPKVKGYPDYRFNPQQAFRWTKADGMVRLGFLPGFDKSIARGVSGDGKVIVGYCERPSVHQAFRWTEADGVVGLGALKHRWSWSEAYAVSSDGSVVVGYSASPSGHQAFRWTKSGGMVGLGYLPGEKQSKAKAVSGDGKVVVGVSGNHAFRWTADGGMVKLVNEGSPMFSANQFEGHFTTTGLLDAIIADGVSVPAAGTDIGRLLVNEVE